MQTLADPSEDMGIYSDHMGSLWKVLSRVTAGKKVSTGFSRFLQAGAPNALLADYLCKDAARAKASQYTVSPSEAKGGPAYCLLTKIRVP